MKQRLGTCVRPLKCGCTVELARKKNPDAGTLQNPWTVKLCPKHAILPELVEVLETLLLMVEPDSSYCDMCDSHAPKNERGELVGQIQHKQDCEYLHGLKLIETARKKKEG